MQGTISVFCERPRFDPAKRTARLNARKQFNEDADKKRGTRKARLDSIKSQCATAGGLLKQICEHVSGQ